MPDVDLNQESTVAATYYVTTKQKFAPLIEQQGMVNHFAKGFYCGFRRAEEKFGINDGVNNGKE